MTYDIFVVFSVNNSLGTHGESEVRSGPGTVQDLWGLSCRGGLEDILELGSYGSAHPTRS